MDTVTVNVSGFKFFGNIILVIAGVVALVYLAQFFKNANKLVKKANELIDFDNKSVNNFKGKLPDILNKTDRVVSEIKNIVEDPNIKEAIQKANSTMTNVKLISDDARDTVNYVGIRIVDSTDSFANGINSVGDYVSMIKDAINIGRKVFKGK